MSTTGIPIQNILFTVFQSIFEVFLLCLAGFTLSFKGVVDKPTSKVLNHINVALFTPALLFSKVAFFLSPAKLRQLWVVPVFFVVLTGVSALIGHWLAKACRLKRSQVNFATAAAMFMNSNSLPVALMQSLASTVPLLKWGSEDTLDAMFSRSLSYLVVFSTLGMMLRWSYGVRILSRVDKPDSHTTSSSAIYRDSDDTSQHPVLAHVAVASPPTARLVEYEIEADDQKWPMRSSRLHPHSTPPAGRHAFAHHPLRSHPSAVPASRGDQSESEDTDDLEMSESESEDTIALPSEHIDTGFSTEAEDAAPLPAPALASSSAAPDGHPAPRWHQRTRPSVFVRLYTTLTSLSPPLLASLLAIFCVLVPPLQRLLQSAEMIPFQGALNNAGGCSIPVTLIILGGWFWDEEKKPQAENGSQDEAGPDGQDNARSKGKGVEKQRPRKSGALAGDRHHSARPSTDRRPRLRPGHHARLQSRDSSASSLSSVIGAFGDALLAGIHPRGSARHSRRHARGSRLAHQADVEPGQLAAHAETEHDSAETGSTSSPPTRETYPPGETLTVVVALLARMVIVPLVMTPLMILVSRFGWGGEVFEDPVFIVSSMLLVASPPALTLAQISHRAKASASTGADTASPFERLLSRTIFWSYLVLTPPITIVSVMVGLLLVEK